MRSRRSGVALAALVIAVALSVGPTHASATTASSGGTIRVVTPLEFSSLDPAASRPAAAAFWYATCATLFAFRDAPAPEGVLTRPEAAAGRPKISRDRRSYSFTVRPGLRFSNGSPVTAANFARALGRVLSPAMNSPGAVLFSDVARVSASGLRLRIKLNEPSGDLTTRLALPFACPVPLGFPIDPAGVDLTLGSGPYYVARFAPASEIVLRRNRHYHGTRPRHVDRVVVTMGGDLDTDIAKVEDGRADVLGIEIPSELRSGLARRYGVNRRQLFRVRGLDTGALVLNTSGALFKDNAALRRAVNFALDRTEIARATPSGLLSRTPTDQIMPRRIPGWRDYRLYPLAHPDLRRARQLARGNLRSGTAVLWATPSTAPGRSIWPAQTELIKSNLRAIGLDVEVKVMAPEVLDAKAGVPGAAYDMLLSEWPLNYPDPANALVLRLGGENARKPSGNSNLAYFDEPAYNRRMVAVDRLTTSARLRAFSKLDADIMRHEAPWAPLYEHSAWLLLSKRVGCLRNQPVFVRDFGAMCLR